MQDHRKTLPEGIDVRHARTCRSREGRRCNCEPTYRARAYSRRDRKRVAKTFPTLAAAKAWRADAQVAIRERRLRAFSAQTLREAGDTYLAGMRDGSIATRSGARYKPSAIRSYADNLRLRVYPAFGVHRLAELGHRDWRLFVERMQSEGVGASTIHNTINPVRAIYRRAVALGDVALNPLANLALPPEGGHRDRIAGPAEARALLVTLPERQRTVWATAFFAGLRIGELQALDWSDVDLAGNLIRISRSWDRHEGAIETKTRAGKRTVPIASELRTHLLAHRLRQGRGAVGLVFATSSGRPFNPSNMRRDGYAAWQAAGLDPIKPHECRHTFVSLLIASGVDIKTVSTWAGHATVSITIDRYGHLLPGAEQSAAIKLDRLLAETGV